MTLPSERNYRPFFYSAWLLIGLVQAYFTELLDDEAYYWVFSRFLDWGYFDHPPMTGLLIKAGYSIIPNELGARLFIVVLSTVTIFLCEKLLERKDQILFYAICLSMAVLQIGGFLAVPDIPLMFFTALFFLSYKKFLADSSLANTLLLGLVTALMLYSKYHAVLIVFFTLLSNPALFKKGYTYLAGFFALLLFVPHLIWQYQHDWISFRYHLFESNVNPYKFSYTTEYILGQLLIAGPIAGFIFWRALVKHTPQTGTEKALKFTGVGIFIFFLLSSFRGRVEANWTAPAIIPLMVLSHQYLQGDNNWRKWTYRLLPLTLVLVLLIRIIIIVDIVPAKAVSERFHQYKQWPQQLKKATGGLPMIFNSSYQKASKYWFYSGQPSLSLNDYKRRRNNYNFWPLEQQVFGGPVYVVDPEANYAKIDSMQTPIGNLHYAMDSAFHSFGNIIFIPAKKEYRVKKGESFVLNASLKPG
ncbi:MAG TPA: glycosyltransferase family 39 protein, partial [Chitinophagaceae bacterium]|nr:glycosyltransferase family 39 protein [Chitinophagaceae bacterium]